MNHTTETDYDKLGRKIEVIQPVPGTGESQPVTAYAYDANGNLKTVTDPRLFVTTYFYDESNRKTVEQDDPGGSLGYSIPGAITTTTAISSTSSMPTAATSVRRTRRSPARRATRRSTSTMP